MSDYNDEEKRAERSPGQKHELWMRLLYIIVLGLAFYVNTMLLCVVVIGQFLFSVFTGSTNANLLQMGGVMSEYSYQLVKFLTFRSDELPFPFNPLPSSE